MDSRNQIFQKLKAPCVALSQATLVFNSKQTNGNEVAHRLASLLGTLTIYENDLDDKLADYVFFPLSQVLQASQRLPIQAMEFSLQCLAILLAKGWRDKIPPSLSSQLIILLSFLGDLGQSKSPALETTDDVRKASFSCMSSLFDSLSLSPRGQASLVEAANIPSLGHAVTVVLEGIVKGHSFDTQFAATGALRSLLTCLTEPEVLASFLPGIVSKLSKALTPSTEIRRHWKVLTLNVQILERLLRLTVSDQATIEIKERANKHKPRAIKADTRYDTAWLQASAGQIKLALASINRLRRHEREEVQEALLSLNLMVLADCKDSLSNCSQLALETALILVEGKEASAGRLRLDILLRADPTVVDMLQSTFHDWSNSLSRIMQSTDDQLRERHLRQVFTAFKILSDSGADVRMPYRILASALQDSVTVVLQPPLPSERSIVQDMEPVLLQDLSLTQNQDRAMVFPTSLLGFKSQDNILSIIRAQLRSSTHVAPIHQLGMSLVKSLHTHQGDAQAAALWLLLTTLETADTNAHDFSEFLALEEASNSSIDTLHEEAYNFSITVLESSEASPRLQLLALQGIAQQARRQKQDFRGELIDSLYPILHHFGSSDPQIRNHAVICLNVISDACNYGSVQDLVVENVDYLVNAVALKLNAFDVSPQGPQVLLMMVRLAGPSLLPYLEDTVDSMFAALEDYHGYPTLVELLFAVLRTMVQEGVKAPLLAIEAGSANGSETETDAWKSTTMLNLVAMIKDSRAERQDVALDDNPDAAPREPWKSAETFDAAYSATQSKEEPDATTEESSEVDTKIPPPAPKTYSLLLKITQLTQHFLPSASPSLRTSLLSLVETAVPALAKHEDSYLPLVNTLWPELVSRLHDPESHVVAASLDTIRVMCQYAGNFMRTRIKSLWPDILAISRRKANQIQPNARRKGSQTLVTTGTTGALRQRPADSRYMDPSDLALWESLEKVLTTIVGHVSIDAEAFDDVLMMLRPLAALPMEVRAVLEAHDPDAVWLAMAREREKVIEKPRLVLASPWRFAEVAV